MALAALLTLLAACQPRQPAEPAEPQWTLSCTFLQTHNSADDAPLEQSNCARRGDSNGANADIQLRPELAAARVPEGSVSSVMVDGELLYLLPSGKTAPALPFDNGTDYFVEGLARTVRHGKVGFVNAQLEEVIPATWDFAFPFRTGTAVVCSGCKIESTGEHNEVTGGLWGYIDRNGEVIVEPTYQRKQLPPRDALTQREAL